MELKKLYIVGENQLSTTNSEAVTDASSSKTSSVDGQETGDTSSAERDGRFGMVMFRPSGQSTTNTVRTKGNRIIPASQVTPQVVQGKAMAVSRSPTLTPRNLPLQAPGQFNAASSATSASGVNQYMVNPYPTITTYSVDQSPSTSVASVSTLSQPNVASPGSNVQKIQSNNRSSVFTTTQTEGPTQPSVDDSFDGLMDFTESTIETRTANTQEGSNMSNAYTGQAQTGGRTVVNGPSSAVISNSQNRSGVSSSGSSLSTGQVTSGSASASGSVRQGQTSQQAPGSSLLSSNSDATVSNIKSNVINNSLSINKQVSAGSAGPSNQQRATSFADISTGNYRQVSSSSGGGSADQQIISRPGFVQNQGGSTNLNNDRNSNVDVQFYSTTGPGNASPTGSTGQGSDTYGQQFKDIWLPVPPGMDSMKYAASPNFNTNNGK